MEVIFFHFTNTLVSERYFLSSGNVFLDKFFIPYGRDGLPCLVKTVYSYLIFFSKSGRKPLMKLVEANFFGRDFVLAERDFPPKGNCFLLLRASFLQLETVIETS